MIDAGVAARGDLKRLEGVAGGVGEWECGERPRSEGAE
jgi:hypothetical protein